MERIPQKNFITNKASRDQIKKDREYWREVLVRILFVFSFFYKNNLAFCENAYKIYEEDNGKFLGVSKMVVGGS